MSPRGVAVESTLYLLAADAAEADAWIDALTSAATAAAAGAASSAGAMQLAVPAAPKRSRSKSPRFMRSIAKKLGRSSTAQNSGSGSGNADDDDSGSDDDDDADRPSALAARALALADQDLSTSADADVDAALDTYDAAAFEAQLASALETASRALAADRRVGTLADMPHSYADKWTYVERAVHLSKCLTLLLLLFVVGVVSPRLT